MAGRRGKRGDVYLIFQKTGKKGKGGGVRRGDCEAVIVITATSKQIMQKCGCGERLLRGIINEKGTKKPGAGRVIENLNKEYEREKVNKINNPKKKNRPSEENQHGHLTNQAAHISLTHESTSGP